MGKKQYYIIITLLLVNYAVILLYPLFFSRIFRLLLTVLFFLFYLKVKSKSNRFLLFSFLFFLISDAFLFFYETPILGLVASLMRVIGYMFILNHFRKLFEHKKSDNIAVGVFIVLGAINIYGLYLVTSYIYKSSNFTQLQEYSVYLHGLVLILACFYAGNNNYTKTTKITWFGAFFIFALALADLCAVIGYYFDFSLFQYLDRTAYVFGMVFLINYAIAIGYNDLDPQKD